MRIALIHDFLIRHGGAERVLAALAEIFPKAPIFTLLYDEPKMGDAFPRPRIMPSNLQRLPPKIRRQHRLLLPLFPRAVEEWDFSQYDLVISSSSAFVHGIITPATTRHICYSHSPMRFAWDWTHEYQRENRLKNVKKLLLGPLLKKIRMWDQEASKRPDELIANSENVRRRIKKYYRRDASVVYPPVDLSRFTVSKSSENFFLIVSNLTPFKRVDLAIALFNRIRRPLIIIGEGPQKRFLESIAGDTIKFLGFQSDQKTAEYMENCRALIFPGEEDFGITPVEAMACGKPVVAFGEGGVCESVKEGVTGEFFREAAPEALEQALARLIVNKNGYAPSACRAQAEKFSKRIFLEKIKKIVHN